MTIADVTAAAELFGQQEYTRGTTDGSSAQAVADQAALAAANASIAALQAQLASGPKQLDVNALVAGGSGTVTIPPGFYRIKAPLRPGPGVKRLIGWGVVLDGSRTLTGWTAQQGGVWYLDGQLPGAYTDAGAGHGEDGSGVQQWREQMWADGVYLRRVMNLNQLVPGTFFQDYTANRIWVADDPTKHMVEVATAPQGLVLGTAGQAAEGMRVQRCANASQSGAVSVERADCHLLEVDSWWNHGRGTTLNNADRTVVTGGTDGENDQLGMAKYRCNGAIVEGRRFLRNNLHGLYQILDWESGGLKWSRCTNGQTNNCQSIGNRGIGMWFDIGNDGEVINRAQIVGNSADGFRNEIGRNSKIVDSLVAGNCLEQLTARGASPVLLQGGEVNVHDCDGANEISGCRIIATLNGIVVQARPRTLDGVSLISTAVTVRGNNVTVTKGLTGTGTLGAGDVSKAVFTDNTYKVDSLTSPRFSVKGSNVPFAQWKQQMEPTATATNA
jgi:hypothetical protein